jgi:RNA polymerase sigma factor (sigma-70 family)
VTTDFDLLDAWAGGDKDAARELVERHFASLFRFFRNKVFEGAEDLVQDTLLACVQARTRFRREASFRTFLFHTARYVLSGHFRKRGRSPIDFESTSAVDLSPSPSAIIVQNAEHRLLLEAMRRLSLDHQIVLELYYWEDLTGPQLAEVLELTEAALRSRLHRAKRELKRHMEAVAASADLLASTWTNLEGWARSLRDRIQRDPS